MIAHATSVSFASVGLALGAGIGLSRLVGEPLVWPVGAFGVSAPFLVVGALEIAFAHQVEDDD